MTTNNNMQIPQVVECTNCRKQFNTKANVKERRTAKVIDIGLECPHCKYFFHSYYLTPDLIKRQRGLKKLRGAPDYRKVLKVYQKKFNALQKRLVNDNL